MKTEVNRSLPAIGDKVRYVGSLLTPWLDEDNISVTQVGLPYARISTGPNFTWVPIQDLVVMEEKTELDEAMQEERKLQEAKDHLWKIVQNSNVDGLAERPELVRFLGDAKRIVGTWNAG